MNILCKLGFHKPSKTEYVRVRITKKRPLKKVHVYHKNYQVCERCGKRLYTFAFKEVK